MAKVEIKDFSLRYYGEEKETLSMVNLTFNTEDRILLYSPSGGGKSSLLLSMLGVIQRNNLGITSGSIHIDGKNLMELSPLEIGRYFGIVFQEPENQFCMMYPKEEIAFGLENYLVDEEKIQDKVDIALKKVGMDSFGSRKLSDLSGGEQQKIALAAALSLESKMLLLDEPTSNMDIQSRKELKKLILKTAKGFFIVEHNYSDWLEDIDKVIYIDRMSNVKVLDKNSLSPSSSLKNRVKSSKEKRKRVFSIEDLTFKYDDKVILNNISLNIYEGEISAIIGKNGAGKSTLSKILAKIYNNYNGKIYYRDMNIEDIGEDSYYNEVAYVFQNPEQQFLKDSVLDEIKLANDIFKNKTSPQAILSEYNLLGCIDKNPFSLSGGEKRRLSVATMLSPNHKVLILDEPTFGLDDENINMLMEKIVKLKEVGMSIIMITHDIDLINRYGEKIIVLDDGKVKTVEREDFSKVYLNNKIKGESIWNIR